MSFFGGGFYGSPPASGGGGGGPVTVADIDSEEAADGHVLTADGEGGAAFEAPAGGGGGPQHNMTADPMLGVPGVNNDSSQGYSAGSMWIFTDPAYTMWICQSAAVGAAVWVEMHTAYTAGQTFAYA